MTGFSFALKSLCAVCLLQSLAACGSQESRSVMPKVVAIDRKLRIGSETKAVAVPRFAFLKECALPSRGTVSLELDGFPRLPKGDSFWIEIFLGNLRSDGSWSGELAGACYVWFGTRHEDSRFEGKLLPGDVLIFGSDQVLRRVSCKQEGNRITFSAPVGMADGCRIVKATSHWFPSTQANWDSPNAWRGTVSSYVRPHKAIMAEELSFASLAGAEAIKLPDVHRQES